MAPTLAVAGLIALQLLTLQSGERIAATNLPERCIDAFDGYSPGCYDSGEKASKDLIRKAVQTFSNRHGKERMCDKSPTGRYYTFTNGDPNTVKELLFGAPFQCEGDYVKVNITYYAPEGGPKCQQVVGQNKAWTPLGVTNDMLSQCAVAADGGFGLDTKSHQGGICGYPFNGDGFLGDFTLDLEHSDDLFMQGCVIMNVDPNRCDGDNT